MLGNHILKDVKNLRKAIFLRDAKTVNEILMFHRNQGTFHTELFKDPDVFPWASEKDNNTIVKKMQEEQVLIACALGFVFIAFGSVLMPLIVMSANQEAQMRGVAIQLFDFPTAALYIGGISVVTGIAILSCTLYLSKEIKIPNAEIGGTQASMHALSQKVVS